jgi:RNA polymerase sigma factor (sigma-70 family)
MSDDAELLRRYAEQRSEAAFAELVRRHLNLVYSAAVRLTRGDTHRAEDVAQLVFTDLARKAAALSRRPVLAGWLYTSTHYATAKILRTEQRRQTREQEAQAMHELLSSAAPEADWDRLHPVLDAAMRELNERDREAVLLRFFEGRGFAEVGAKLNLTENAARMRVDRALDKLRVRLSEHGVTSTAAALAIALANQAVVAAPAGLATTVTGAALTGAAAGGGAWAVLQFIATNKLQIGIVSAVIATAGTGVVLQQQTNAQLQCEIEVLRQENRQIAALQEENLHLKQTAAEVATLRADDAELAQLGTEATALKVRLQAQARAQTANRAAAATGPNSVNVFNLAQLDKIPVARYQARPVYPFELSRAGITGEATIGIIVDPEGNVREAYTVKTTRPEFGTAATEAVQKWKFQPGQKGGIPVNTRLQVPIVFSLSGPSVGGTPLTFPSALTSNPKE